jgi:hypothetical protein
MARLEWIAGGAFIGNKLLHDHDTLKDKNAGLRMFVPKQSIIMPLWLA